MVYEIEGGSEGCGVGSKCLKSVRGGAVLGFDILGQFVFGCL